MKAAGAVEFELRFQVPRAALPALEKAFSSAKVETVDLHATYFDTADRRLAAAGHVLRLRREGPRWVQALKSRGDGLAARPEHEVDRGGARRAPAPDPALHAATPEGRAVLALLADGAPLQAGLQTRIRRRTRVLRHGGARIEICLDQGRLAAGGAVRPVAEVEFELRTGPPQALLALAERWAWRHGLWLEARTKSERGALLAQGLAAGPPRKAEAATWPAEASTGAAFAALLHEALLHLLPNAAVLAEGRATPEHVHQARVALRRLRSVLHCLGRWSGAPAQAAMLDEAWREPARRLGARRDADVLAAMRLPGLADLPATPGVEDPGAVVREAAFTQRVLQTLALTLAPPAAARPAARGAASVLAHAWKAAAAGAARFAEDDETARHRTRRRLKRLRYAAEGLLPVLPAGPATRALRWLGAVLEPLGEANDLHNAHAWLLTLGPGWTPPQQTWHELQRRRRKAVRRATRLLQQAHRHAAFWRRG